VIEVQVTKGQPDDDELAAVVIALDIVAARVAAAPPQVSRWRVSLHPRSLNATRDRRRKGWRSAT
jgi:Acyl-CoA carboxylase epsilon subunit